MKVADLSDYARYRGKCKEMSEDLIRKNPELKLVRGHYYCPIWNRDEPHWWCVASDGTIVDPTARQFASKGMGVYTPFDGMVECAECGKEMKEEDSGKVISCAQRRSRELRLRAAPNGYFRVGLVDNDGKYIDCSVHRIVALIHLGVPEEFMVVNHKDGNKKNNHVSNLEWLTSSGNAVHAIKNGLRNAA